MIILPLGVCFGEIALLGSGKMNRRTANVRAHGFTTLYVLFKEDLVIKYKLKKHSFIVIQARIAQLVVYWLVTGEVPGSNENK